MINDSNHTYTYNGANQITGVDGTNNTYAYDADGRRVSKIQGTNSNIYVYSGGQPIAEYANGAAANSPSVEYVYAGGSRVASITSGAITYALDDQLSTRLEVDSSATTIRTFGHFPFGETWYEPQASSKWKFTSYERDSESGLDYADARYEASQFGRFTSLDPLSGSPGNPQSLNRYAYVGNDPVNFTDPTGRLRGANSLCWFKDNGDVGGCFGTGGIIDGQWIPFGVNMFVAGGFNETCPQCIQLGQTATAANGMSYTVKMGDEGNPAWFNDANGEQVSAGELGLPDDTPDNTFTFIQSIGPGGDRGPCPAYGYEGTYCGSNAKQNDCVNKRYLTNADVQASDALWKEIHQIDADYFKNFDWKKGGLGVLAGGLFHGWSGAGVVLGVEAVYAFVDLFSMTAPYETKAADLHVRGMKQIAKECGVGVR